MHINWHFHNFQYTLYIETNASITFYLLGWLSKYLLLLCFLPQFPNRYHERSCCGPFGAEHHNRYQNPFLNPQGMISTPVHTYGIWNRPPVKVPLGRRERTPTEWPWSVILMGRGKGRPKWMWTHWQKGSNTPQRLEMRPTWLLGTESSWGIWW